MTIRRTCPSFIRTTAVAITAVLLAPPKAQAASAYEEANVLYRGKDYAAAATKYVEAAREKPGFADAAYYAAYASYQAGKKPDAIELFWYVAKKCPTSKHAFSARSILKKIDRQYDLHSRDNSVGTLPLPSSTTDDTTQVAAKPTYEQIVSDKKAIIDWLIQKTPRRSNRPDVTSEFVAEIKECLGTFSLQILSFLKKNNCHVVITPCVVEKDFRMEGFRPGGYSEGSTMEDVPALFDFHDIVIGQYLPKGTGGYKQNPGILGTVRHEIGHAIDHFSGRISQKNEFAHARVWDYPGRDTRELAYFLGAGRGDAEAFAELCAYKFGGRTDENRSKSCQLLKRYAKRSYPIVEQAIQKIESGTD